MKKYFVWLFFNGYLSIIGAVATVPCLFLCIFFGPVVLWIWLGVWVLAFLVGGFVDPNKLWTKYDDPSVGYQNIP